MSEIEERLLERCLIEVVGEETPPDLEPRIATAIRMERTRGRRRAWAAAAVLLVVVGAVFAVIQEREPAPTEAPAPIAAGLSKSERERLDAVLSRLDPSGLDPSGSIGTESGSASAELRAAIADRPAACSYVRSRLLSWIAEAPNAAYRRALIDALVVDPHPTSRALIETQLRLGADALSLDALVFMGEEGSESALRQLRAIAAAADGAGMAHEYVSAFLGSRGDATGLTHLERFVANPGNARRYLNLYLAAAAALRTLGQPDAWRRAVSDMESLLLATSPQQRQTLGARLVPRVEYFGASPPARHSFLADRLRPLEEAELGRRASPEELLARLRVAQD